MSPFVVGLGEPGTGYVEDAERWNAAIDCDKADSNGKRRPFDGFSIYGTRSGALFRDQGDELRSCANGCRRRIESGQILDR